MNWSDFIRPETPFYIIGFLAVITYLLRRIKLLENTVETLQKVVTRLSGVHLAVKNCPVKDCKLKSIEPLPSVVEQIPE